MRERGRRAVVVVPAVVLIVLLRPAPTSAVPPTTDPVATAAASTTVPTTSGAPPTTDRSGASPNLVGPPRVGTRNGVLTKPEHPGWSVRRMIGTTAAVLGVLVVLGWIYGRIRSIPPRRPEMSTLPEVIREP